MKWKKKNEEALQPRGTDVMLQALVKAGANKRVASPLVLLWTLCCIVKEKFPVPSEMQIVNILLSVLMWQASFSVLLIKLIGQPVFSVDLELLNTKW